MQCVLLMKDMYFHQKWMSTKLSSDASDQNDGDVNLLQYFCMTV